MELVNFETAKKLRGLNFSVGTSLGYTSKGKLEIPYYGNEYHHRDTSNSVSFEAPYLALVQEWLREIHDISLWLVPGPMGGWKFIISSRDGDYLEGLLNAEYDETLEAGIIEGIELIKS